MSVRCFLLIVVLFWPQPTAFAVERTASVDSAELIALEKFLSFSDAELEAMEAAIARVRSMTSEQRRVFRERIIAFRGLPAVRRDEIRAGWGWVSDEDREDWRRMMQSLSPEDRNAVHTRMGEIPAAERAAFKHAMLEEWRPGPVQSRPTQ